MKKRTLQLLLTGFAIVSLVLVGTLPALATPGVFEPRPELDGGRQCGGVLVVNVSQRVQNDADSAVTRPVWAFDDLTRYIRVYQTAPLAYCATVEYKNGVFVTTAGPSPMGTDPDGIVGGIIGAFYGGYRATFNSPGLNPTPAYKKTGFIGTFDYACDVDPGCPGYVDWVGVYFPGYTNFDQPYWGWRYTSNQNGSVWTNACSGPDPDCPGNSGDITD